MARIAVIFLMFIGLATGAAAQEKVLRYVSQRGDKAYLREGPSYAHKVLWVYRHRGYPYAVIAQFDIWRRVRAADGTYHARTAVNCVPDWSAHVIAIADHVSRPSPRSTR